LVFGAFLEAPKSYRHDSQTVTKLSSIRTQRSLFRRILRLFGHPNMAKHRGVSSKRAVGGPFRGSPALGVPLGARPSNGRALVLTVLGYSRARGPRSFPARLSSDLGGVVSPFWARILWFSGLFSKHRSRIDMILEPLRSFLRYGHNGPCFARF